MSDAFQCPKCAQRYALKDGLVGKQVACKKCGTTFFVVPAVPVLLPLAADPHLPRPAPVTALPTPVAAVAPLPQPVSSGMDDLLNEALLAGPAANPASLAAGPVLGPIRPRGTKGGKNWLWIGVGGGGVLLLLVVLLAVVLRRGQAGPSADAPGNVASGNVPRTAARGSPMPSITPTAEVPADVPAPADLNPNTVGGLKSAEQLVDDMIAQIDELLRLMGAVQDEASLKANKPRIVAQIATLSQSVSLLRSPAMFGERAHPEKIRRWEQRQTAFQKQAMAEGGRISKIPGGPELLGEFRKLGQFTPAPAMPAAPDPATLATLPLEEQVKWYMRRKGPGEVYAVVFEGLTPQDLPRIDNRLRSLNAHDGPTVFQGNRCIKYVHPVVRAEMLAGLLNVGDMRVNAAKRIAIITVDRTRLQNLP